jgi:TonB family protein
MPRDTKALVWKSVFQTAAFAGYPNLSFAVGTGTPGRLARVVVDAQVPGPAPIDPSTDHPSPEPVLVLRLVPGSAVVLTWKRGAETLSVVEVPWGDAFERRGEDVRAPALAARLSREWSMQAQHKDPLDKRLDQAIVHADEATELRDLVAVLDALYETKRSMGSARVAAFNATLSIYGDHAGNAMPSSSAAMGPGAALGAANVKGRLPPEVIQRIVRANFATLRKCYEAGLARNASLAGKVRVRFVIGKDGAVTSVADAGGSDMPDAAVKQCVLAGFSKLAFPQPEGGIVTVEYPIQFTPSP